MYKSFIGALVALAAATAFAAVDVNKASEADLDSIKGIGPAMSAKILKERSKKKFAGWQDLIDRVNGVGPTSASKFSESGLTVNGKPFNAELPALPSQPAKGK